MFTDIGSGKLDSIGKKLGNKRIFILDHHEISSNKERTDTVVHANPHLYGIDGGINISGAGVSFLFARALNEQNKDLAHIAVIGAIGDVQENRGFQRLNNDILQLAVAQEKIKVIDGLRLFGAYTRPLHKVLEYSTDPYIPGVSGSESAAIGFLNQLGISPKQNDGSKSWKKLIHLKDDEMKRLVAGIVVRRFSEEKPEDILGKIYILNDEEDETPMKECREFSTLLNACGRLGKASLGIGACIGDAKLKKKAINALMDYKREIIRAINWYHDNKNDSRGSVIRGNKFVLINAQDNILHTIIGTLASILTKSNEFEDGTLVLSMAQCFETKTTKISLRAAGRSNTIDLRELMQKIVDNSEGECGGHKNAAGAVIPTNAEQKLIDAAKIILEQASVEEKVC
jgi:RecJ-like exonuclease